MLNSQQLIIDGFIDQIEDTYHKMYSKMHLEYRNIISWCSRLALENIGNTDALYHNMEHTVLVTLAGQAILEGKHRLEGGVSPQDWMQATIALLCHDIGYVRGICRLDQDGKYASGKGNELIELPAGATDAALTPYHVDRSKQFVLERFGGPMLGGVEAAVDAKKIAEYIEFTRFPPQGEDKYKDTQGFGGLVRAADFIGQLGDPGYLRKIPSLYYEFEEIDANKNHGYKHPDDMRRQYAGFFWDVVSPYIQDALRYLRVTVGGKQWISSLYAHVFEAEHTD